MDNKKSYHLFLWQKTPKLTFFRKTLHFGFPSCHFNSSALMSQAPQECSHPFTASFPLSLSAQRSFPLQNPSLLASHHWVCHLPVPLMFSEPHESCGHSPLFFRSLAVTQSIPSLFLRSSSHFCHRIRKKNDNCLLNPTAKPAAENPGSINRVMDLLLPQKPRCFYEVGLIPQYQGFFFKPINLIFKPSASPISSYKFIPGVNPGLLLFSSALPPSLPFAKQGGPSLTEIN